MLATLRAASESVLNEEAPERLFAEFLEKLGALPSTLALRHNFVAAAHEAIKSPKALYRFFDMYNHLNGQIFPSIAVLQGNIAASRDMFFDPAEPVFASADVSDTIAHLVGRASTDEYADPSHRDEKTGEGLSHRVLAAGLLKSIGDFAQLGADERNESYRTIPDSFKKLSLQIQQSYMGIANDRLRLAQAVGVHLASENSADATEFPEACKLLFIEKKGQGFDAYLRKHPDVTLGRHTFKAISWLQTHGGYDEQKGEIIHGVEHTHLRTGFLAAAKMIAATDRERQNQVTESIISGIDHFNDLMSRSFIEMKRECEVVNRNSGASCISIHQKIAACG